MKMARLVITEDGEPIATLTRTVEDDEAVVTLTIILDQPERPTQEAHDAVA